MKTKKTSAFGTYVELNSHELLWLAESGQPYRGQLFIQYESEGKVIELISLKKYIESLRKETILLEDIAYRVYNDINKELDNESLQITVRTTARGGISSTIVYGSNLYGEPISKPIVFGV